MFFSSENKEVIDIFVYRFIDKIEQIQDWIKTIESFSDYSNEIVEILMEIKDDASALQLNSIVETIDELELVVYNAKYFQNFKIKFDSLLEIKTFFKTHVEQKEKISAQYEMKSNVEQLLKVEDKTISLPSQNTSKKHKSFGNIPLRQIISQKTNIKKQSINALLSKTQTSVVSTDKLSGKKYVLVKLISPSSHFAKKYPNWKIFYRKPLFNIAFNDYILFTTSQEVLIEHKQEHLKNNNVIPNYNNDQVLSIEKEFQHKTNDKDEISLLQKRIAFNQNNISSTVKIKNISSTPIPHLNDINNQISISDFNQLEQQTNHEIIANNTDLKNNINSPINESLSHNKNIYTSNTLENKEENKELIENLNTNVELVALNEQIESENSNSNTQKNTTVAIKQQYDEMEFQLSKLVKKLNKVFDKKSILNIEGLEDIWDYLSNEKANAIYQMLCELISNSIEHGIESKEKRQVLNKSAISIINVNVENDGEKVSFRYQDDGEGLNQNKIKEAAIRNGVLSFEQALHLDNKTCIQLAFKKNFSTKKNGDGNGLYLVKDIIQMFRAKTNIQSSKMGFDFSILFNLHD